MWDLIKNKLIKMRQRKSTEIYEDEQKIIKILEETETEYNE